MTMNDEPDSPSEAVGTIVGTKGGDVVVRLDNGEELLCRSMRRLHRSLGFYVVPVGRRARIRFPLNERKLPLIVEVLPD